MGTERRCQKCTDYLKQYYIDKKVEELARHGIWAEANKAYLAEYQKRRRREKKVKSPAAATKTRTAARLYKHWKKYYLKNTYGLSSEEFAAITECQDGKCQICKKVTKPLHVDHDHKTGAFRGLLCGFCNRGLGSFRDDPALLIRAAEYLK